MAFLSEAIEYLKMGNYGVAAEILKERINQGNLSHESKFQLAEWVAECYKEVKNHEEAGKWFEEAAKVALENPRIPSKRTRFLIASKEYQKALDCYMDASNHDLIKRASAQRFRCEQVAQDMGFVER
jgi:Tfp pilus assembly protein PilF